MLDRTEGGELCPRTSRQILETGTVFDRCTALASTSLRQRAMLYTILCYNSEETIGTWSQEEDDAVMARLAVVQDKLARNGKLGPVARLRPTKTARTLWKDREPHFVTDGPYAETKEQILGFYVIDCESDDEAMDIARELGRANPGGAYEVRPVLVFFPDGVNEMNSAQSSGS